GAFNTIFGGVAGAALFFTWLNRLDQQDEIVISFFAAVYQMADWAATPSSRFSDTRVYPPVFPRRWVQVRFLGVPSNMPLSPKQQDRMNSLEAAWNRGAEQLRQQLEPALRKSHAAFLAKLAKKGLENPTAKVPFARFEDLAKLALLDQAGALKYSSRDVRGA